MWLKVNSQSPDNIKRLKKDGMGLYNVSLWFFTVVKMVVRVIAIKWCFRVGNMNLLLEKCWYFAKMVYWDLRLAMDISVVKFFQSQHPWLVRFLDLNKPGKRKLGYIELWG